VQFRDTFFSEYQGLVDWHERARGADALPFAVSQLGQAGVACNVVHIRMVILTQIF
jgi:hypothetical protein